MCKVGRTSQSQDILLKLIHFIKKPGKFNRNCSQISLARVKDRNP